MKKLIIILLFFCQLSQAQNNWYGAISSGAPHFKGIGQLWLGRISGNYLMCENGDSLLITGKDFDATWTQGIPYKSACFISQTGKWKQATVKDTGNFWFAVDGTPNLIPVVSLFQNIDYNCVIYTKHEAQKLDANGVETYEPRVSQICTYKTRQRSVDSILCNRYFGVPVMDATAKWIAPNGNDVSGNGTKNNPWATHAKAQSTAPTSSTIYVKSGTYNINSSQVLSNLNFQGLGNVIVKDGTSTAIMFDLTSVTVSRHTFDANSKALGACKATSGNVTVDKCRFINLARRAFYSSNSGIFIVSDNSLYKNETSYSLIQAGCATLKLLNNHISGTMTYVVDNQAANQNIYSSNNKITVTLQSSFSYVFYKLAANTQNIRCIGDKINLSTGGVINGTTANIPGNNTLKYCNIIATGSNASMIGGGGIGSDTIEDCNFNITTSATYSMWGQERSLVLKNSFISSNQELFDYQAGANIVNILIDNNYLYNSGTTAFSYIGNELARDWINAIFRNNTMRVAYYVVGRHGIQFFDCKTVQAYNNNLKDIGLGLVLKSIGTITHGDNIFHHNILDNSTISMRSIDSAKIYNNTLTNTYILMNQNLVHPCRYIDIKNNIFKHTTRCIEGQSGDTYFDDYNCYYTDNDIEIINGANQYTLAQWQALGNSLHSVNQNPNFKSTTELWPVIPLTIGANLGATYNVGLDTTTTWGSSTTLPNIVTKNQAGSWQIGAYVK